MPYLFHLFIYLEILKLIWTKIKYGSKRYFKNVNVCYPTYLLIYIKQETILNKIILHIKRLGKHSFMCCELQDPIPL